MIPNKLLTRRTFINFEHSHDFPKYCVYILEENLAGLFNDELVNDDERLVVVELPERVIEKVAKDERSKRKRDQLGVDIEMMQLTYGYGNDAFLSTSFSHKLPSWIAICVISCYVIFSST